MRRCFDADKLKMRLLDRGLVRTCTGPTPPGQAWNPLRLRQNWIPCKQAFDFEFDGASVAQSGPCK